MSPRLALALVALLLVPPVAAQEHTSDGRRYSLTIRGADVTTALSEIVRLTGIDLVYPSALASDQSVYCSASDATAEDLLRCVLDGSGLDFVRTSAGTYVLIEAPVQQPLSGRLAGRVVDARTGAPLPFAHVLLADASIATAADEDGLFAFADLQPGRYEVVATHVAYAPSGPQAIFVEPGMAARVEVVLDGAPAEAAPVVVDGLAQRIPSALLGLGERDLAGNPIVSTGVGTSDVMAGARDFLGVAAVPAVADLHVQGGSATEHLVLLDGVAVRDPVALGRHLGAFSPLALDRMTIHKAGFGGALGSQLTGVVELTHRLDTGPAVAMTADPVSTNARVNTPLALPGLGPGALMVALRQSLWDVRQEAGLRTMLREWGATDPVFTSLWLGEDVRADDLAGVAYRPTVAFTDLHAAARFRPDALSTVHVSGYHARNHVDADRAVTRTEAAEVLAFRDEYDWRNWAGQARARRLVGARGVVGVQARGAYHRSGYDYRFNRGALDPADATATAEVLFNRVAEGQGGDAAHRLTELALDVDGSLSLAPGREVRAILGAAYTRARFDAGHVFIAPLALASDAWHLSGTVEARSTIGFSTTLEGSTRLTYVPASQTLYAEPRGAIRYDGTGAVGAYALRLAGGLYRQFVNGFAFRNPGPAAIAPELLFWLPVSEGAPPRAIHLSADALVMPNETWTLRAEAFARWEGLVLTLDVPALQAARDVDGQLVTDDRDALASATGRTVGGGLRLDYHGSRLRGGVSYAFEDAQRTVPGRYDGQRLVVPWSAPHRLRGDADLRFVGRLGLDAVGFRALGQAALGRTWGYRSAYYDYLPDVSSPLLDAGFRAELDEPDAARLPADVRVDLGVYAEHALGPTQLRLDVGVTDVLDRTNAYDWTRSSPNTEGLPRERGLPGRRWTVQLRMSL
ncbi:MAG: carboxypeptidase regulatory-like domain-containing protein [Bacteroidota bacterium]